MRFLRDILSGLVRMPGVMLAMFRMRTLIAKRRREEILGAWKPGGVANERKR